MSTTTDRRADAGPTRRRRRSLRSRARRAAADRARRGWVRLRLRPRCAQPLVRLGTSYGGWWVPEGVTGPGTVAYCAGAGEDISFDLALFERGGTVRVFDPTPRAVDFVRRSAPDSARFAFLPIGWWSRRERLRFFVPADPVHVSHSLVNLQGTQDFLMVDVAPVHELAHDLGDAHVDLIKMDIEGAEAEVLPSLLRDGPLPEVLCVEFDQPQPISRIFQTTAALAQRGLWLAKIDGWNFTYCTVRQGGRARRAGTRAVP